MSNVVVPLRGRRQGELHGRMTLVGFHVDERITFEEWAADGEVLTAMHNSSAWAVGDWISEGEKRFGEAHAQALGDYFAPETLARYRKVAMAFPITSRRPSISFGHHHAVVRDWLSPAERDEVLDLAVAHRWGRAATRDEVTKRKAAKDAVERAESAKTAPPMDLGDEPEPAPGDGAESAESAESSAGEVSGPLVPGGEMPEIVPPTLEPMSTVDAAAYLLALARAQLLPDNMTRAVLAVLVERTALLRVLNEAEQSLRLGFFTPGLTSAAAALRPSEKGS